MTAELTALAMPHARISVALTALAEPAPHGVDDVEIRLAAHPGAPALPLHKGASGGELSRVMLAIEVVFAGADPVPTFVFDEVDAGVGGKAAVEIGRRLAKLARLAQVIVVTHLPQVAAFADNHLVVAKSSDGTITSSSVIRLDHEARVRELSRMLAGLEDSEFGQAHAAELLAPGRRAGRTALARHLSERGRWRIDHLEGGDGPSTPFAAAPSSGQRHEAVVVGQPVAANGPQAVNPALSYSARAAANSGHRPGLQATRRRPSALAAPSRWRSSARPTPRPRASAAVCIDLISPCAASSSLIAPRRAVRRRPGS